MKRIEAENRSAAALDQMKQTMNDLRVVEARIKELEAQSSDSLALERPSKRQRVQQSASLSPPKSLATPPTSSNQYVPARGSPKSSSNQIPKHPSQRSPSNSSRRPAPNSSASSNLEQQSSSASTLPELQQQSTSTSVAPKPQHPQSTSASLAPKPQTSSKSRPSNASEKAAHTRRKGPILKPWREILSERGL